MSAMGGRQRRREIVRVIVCWVVVLAIVGVPLWVMVLTAAKPAEEAHIVSLQLPNRFALIDNLTTVMEQGRTLRSLLNSTLIAVPTISMIMLFAAMTAWVLGRGRRVGSTILYYLFLTGVILPPSLIAAVRVLQSIGLYNTPGGLILYYVGISLGGAVFLMTGFVRGIPYSLEEAARIDGAGALRLFFVIILPSLRPIMLTVGIAVMLGVWNEFFAVFFLLPNPEYATLPMGLYNFAAANQHQLNWNLIFMQIILVSLPLLAVFLTVQRRIIGGLLSGSGK